MQALSGKHYPTTKNKTSNLKSCLDWYLTTFCEYCVKCKSWVTQVSARFMFSCFLDLTKLFYFFFFRSVKNGLIVTFKKN